jgi:cystathionine beta-lyase
MKTDTQIIHHRVSREHHHGFVNPPLYRGSTVLYEDVASMNEINADPLKLKAPAYGRFGTPVSRSLEDLLTSLEGGEGTVLTNSGLSAVTTALLALVKTGDHLLITDSVYWPTRSFCQFLKGLGIEAEFYDPCIGEKIEQKLRSNTKLVFMESPGSLSFEVQDVPAIVRACRAKGILTLIDNTWATPLCFRPLQLGVDVSIHAGTKYLSGHADAFLGAIICGAPHFATIRAAAIRLGQSAAPEDVHLCLRGSKTLSTRLKQHLKSGLEIAGWFKQRKEIEEVLYPPLPGTPGHEIWKRDFTGGCGLMGVIFKEQYKNVDALANGLSLFGLGHSWGGYESLVLPAHPEAFRLPGSWKEKGALLRFHVGLEDSSDLLADLEDGFSRLRPGILLA